MPKIMPTQNEVSLIPHKQQTAFSNDEFEKRFKQQLAEQTDIEVLASLNEFETLFEEKFNPNHTFTFDLSLQNKNTLANQVADFFSKVGNKIGSKIKNKHGKELFHDILSARLDVALDNASKIQSEAYQDLKEQTTNQALELILKMIKAYPDISALLYGEKLLRGTVHRLYKNEDQKLLKTRINAALETMYCGAITTISETDPINALNLVHKWKSKIGKDSYDQLRNSLEKKAWWMQLLIEYNNIKFAPKENIPDALKNIEDKKMRFRIGQMIKLSNQQESEKQELNKTTLIDNECRKLFELYTQAKLTPEEVAKAVLDNELKSKWQKIMENNFSTPSDQAFYETIVALKNSKITHEHQIYLQMSKGLCAYDVQIILNIINIIDKSQLPLILDSVDKILLASKSFHNSSLKIAAIRDFLKRLEKKDTDPSLSISDCCSKIISEYC